MEPLGLNFIKLGLQDVLYNPETKSNPNHDLKTERFASSHKRISELVKQK